MLKPVCLVTKKDEGMKGFMLQKSEGKDETSAWKKGRVRVTHVCDERQVKVRNWHR